MIEQGIDAFGKNLCLSEKTEFDRQIKELEILKKKADELHKEENVLLITNKINELNAKISYLDKVLINLEVDENNTGLTIKNDEVAQYKSALKAATNAELAGDIMKNVAGPALGLVIRFTGLMGLTFVILFSRTSFLI